MLLIMTFLTLDGGADRGVEAVEGSITAMENLLGLSMTLHDPYGQLARHPGWALLARRYGSHRKLYLCGVGFCQKCAHHCGVEANRRAAQAEAPFIHQCWKGLSEIVIPIHREGYHVATCFAGMWRVAGESGSRFKGRTVAWEKRRALLGVLSLPEARRQVALLAAFVRGIFEDVQNMTGRDVSAPTRRQEIVRFLCVCKPEASSLRDLAATLHVSPSRASHLVRELFGTSYRELLKGERIERAKSLLVSTDLPIKEIARRAGVDNPYYFSRLFRQVVGCTASDYRKAGACGSDLAMA